MISAVLLYSGWERDSDQRRQAGYNPGLRQQGNQSSVKLKLNDGTQYPGIYQRKQSDLWDIQQVFHCWEKFGGPTVDMMIMEGRGGYDENQESEAGSEKFNE